MLSGEFYNIEGRGNLSDLSNSPVAILNRLALISEQTKQHILAAFADDNYVLITPRESRKVIVTYPLEQ